MSIKKAQHAAAALALTKTNYKQPLNKMKLRSSGHYSNSNFTIKNSVYKIIKNVFDHICL